MATVIPIDVFGPEFRVFVDSQVELDLGAVSRFLQRLDTGTRRIAAAHGARSPTIHIVSLSTGSPLDTKLRLQDRRGRRTAIAISATALAFQVADYLRSDPAAARSSREIIVTGNAPVIIVEGGGSRHEIRPSDLDAADERAIAAAASANVELLTGPQEGFIVEVGGEPCVELRSHPGLFIRIRDQRDDPEPLQSHSHYTLDGEAHISHRPGRPSYFILERAFRL
jgi:hypothetical protein